LLRHASVALLAVALVGACGSDELPSSGRIIDDAGRVVRLDAPAQRIVSLSPSTTELLFAIGAGDRVVGRTRWCADPPAALEVESVGDGLDPNVELIVAQRPDLVVFYQSGMNDPAIAQLERLGITTASVQLDGLADLARAARLLGRLTGDSARTDTLVRIFEGELAAVSTTPAEDAATVLMLAWDNPPIVIGSASFLSEIVSRAGARNLFADLAQPSGSVSLEAIAARAPDVVLLTEGDSAPAFARRPEWQVVKAVREGRFASVRGSHFSHPSFRAAQAIAQLRAALEGWRR
jgi:ABC-type Fe3+-hydroxamate transport system substrate-binding protein